MKIENIQLLIQLANDLLSHVKKLLWFSKSEEERQTESDTESRAEDPKYFPRIRLRPLFEMKKNRKFLYIM